ncbi:unnamed protein product, partial [Toxocara canis]|uniref:Sulfate_transp domain-containing protein n=1 Tax=Toxocara canis TaxID=6265 RepID=A0A183V7Q3_TOXCA
MVVDKRAPTARRGTDRRSGATANKNEEAKGNPNVNAKRATRSAPNVQPRTGVAEEKTEQTAQMGTQSSAPPETLTDSTPFSLSEGSRKMKPKKVINVDELMKEDVTPISEKRPQSAVPIPHRQTLSPPTRTAVQTPSEQKVLEITPSINTSLLLRFRMDSSLRDADVTGYQGPGLKGYQGPGVHSDNADNPIDLDPQLIYEGKKPPINQEQFDKKHGFRRTNLSIMRKLVYHLNLVRTWKKVEWIHFCRRRIPLLSWLPVYDWKDDFLNDIINGIMLSILYIPQGLAYGMMVGVPPIYGVYTGIVGPLVYAFLGTSHHASTGAFAIVSLMVSSVVEQVSSHGSEFHFDAYNDSRLCCLEQVRKSDPMEAVKISSLLAFFVGIIQVVLGLLNAGLLAVWLSDQLVEGLTSGAAVHVLFSQLKSMTGVKNVPRTSDNFGIIKFAICFIKNTQTVSYQTTICSLICCACLLFSKTVIDPVLKPWMKIKFPMELLVVMFSILLCFLGAGTPLEFHVDIVGEVEVGMKPPTMPDFTYTNDVIFSAFPIAIVSFVIHIALAKLVAKQFNYQVNANQVIRLSLSGYLLLKLGYLQEWLALGSMHAIASFFGCFAGGSSLSRTITSANLGTKSQ